MATTRSIPAARRLSMDRSTLERTLQSRNSEYSRLQAELATGQKIRRPSDDPTGFGIARRLDALVGRYEQYERSVASATAWTDQTQSALDHLAELFTQAYEQGIRAANDTYGTVEREAVASRLDRIFDEVVDSLNHRGPDGYVFAGTNSAEKPFLNDSSATADTAGITYYGNANSVTRATGPDLKMDIGIAGSRVLNTGSGYTITEAFNDLVASIRSGDAADMQTAIGRVVTSRDHLADMGTEAGTIAERLSTISTQLQESSLRVQAQRSQIEDADVAETIIEIQRAETGLQATMQALSSMSQMSILNFLP